MRSWVDLNERLDCYFCNGEHQIPKIGFSKDKRIEMLIDQEFHRTDFGKSYTKAVDLSKDLNDMIEKVQTFMSELEGFIDDYFGQIINRALIC